MKVTNRLVIAPLVCCALLSPPAAAQDVKAGYLVAQRWCSGCHEIEKGRFETGMAPSFASIASRPTTTAASLDWLLSKPHDPMPGYLMRQETEDVSAYIASLK